MSTVRRMGNDRRRAVYLRDRSVLTPAQRRRIRHKAWLDGAR
jgi:hypothetical protein